MHVFQDDMITRLELRVQKICLLLDQSAPLVEEASLPHRIHECDRVLIVVPYSTEAVKLAKNESLHLSPVCVGPCSRAFANLDGVD